MLFPHRNAADSFAVPGALTGAQGRIRDFCDGVLGESLPEDHLIFEEGDVASVAARVAEELGAHIVVMGSAANGKIASEVACQARVPVFVARAPRAGTIVAATDLSDPRFPVLRRAGDLAGRSDRRTTIVHNVPPATGFDLYSMGVTPRFWPAEHEDADILSQYRRRLSALAGTLGIPAEPVVMTSASTSAAILEVGQETDADLLVVGAHPRSWLGRLLSPSVAETVVDRAARSVLVLPLSGEEHLAAATEPVPTAWAA
ncbi:MAG: universal stress protein, partial [Polyangiaceae bacterium]